MDDKLQKSTPQESELLLYTSPDGDVKIDVYFHDETVWLTQKRMAELFDVDRSVVTKHLSNIFNTSELLEKSVSANFAHTAAQEKCKQQLQSELQKTTTRNIALSRIKNLSLTSTERLRSI